MRAYLLSFQQDLLVSRQAQEEASLVVAVTHSAEGHVGVLQAAILGADERRQQTLVRVQLVQELDVVLSLLPIRRIATSLRRDVSFKCQSSSMQRDS